MSKNLEARTKQTKHKKYILVRYGRMSTLGLFEHHEPGILKVHSRVVIKTSRGLELGYLVGRFSSYKSGQFRLTQEQIKEYFDNEEIDRDLIVSSLGRIGGLQARNMLIDLYENENLYDDLKISKKEKQKIQVAILKALSKIGDDVSKSKIELYVAKHKSTFFKKDAIAETAAILLDKIKK